MSTYEPREKDVVMTASGDREWIVVRVGITGAVELERTNAHGGISFFAVPSNRVHTLRFVRRHAGAPA